MLLHSFKTAIKVLLRRYVWQRTLFPGTVMATEETFAMQQAQEREPGTEAPVGK